MELSLFSRDVVAMAAAVALSHDAFSAVIFLGVCDKIAPGMAIAAAAFGHLPVVFAPAGPMPSGLDNAEKARVRERHAAGEVGREALLAAETASYHAPGTCTFYGTANTNQMMLELMGLQLPGASFVNPGTPVARGVDSRRGAPFVRRYPDWRRRGFPRARGDGGDGVVGGGFCQRNRRRVGERRLDQSHDSFAGDGARLRRRFGVGRFRRVVAHRAAALPLVSQRARGCQSFSGGGRDGVFDRRVARGGAVGRGCAHRRRTRLGGLRASGRFWIRTARRIGVPARANRSPSMFCGRRKILFRRKAG